MIRNPEEVHQTYQRPNGTDAANARQGRISFQHTYEVSILKYEIFHKNFK